MIIEYTESELYKMDEDQLKVLYSEELQNLFSRSGKLKRPQYVNLILDAIEK